MVELCVPLVQGQLHTCAAETFQFFLGIFLLQGEHLFYLTIKKEKN